MDSSVAASFETLANQLKEIQKKVDRCELCRGGHGTDDCPLLGQEEVDFIGKTIGGQNRGPTNPFIQKVLFGA
ncbi:MAG: hypothetical protein Q8755_02795 [Candidatus Phytoplasma australasiaticum]|nr:hypothetical protein [Candidatus Phytoplasma australasiaticum]